MNEHKERNQQFDIAEVSKESNSSGTMQFADNRQDTIAQRKLRDSMSASNENSANPIQRKNNTGLPNNLKSGIENLSGFNMDDVKVHYNSSKPAQLQAHAYAQGTDIHLASGQEKHLPHEAWHVVQQKQGRVKPTRQLKSKVNINDDEGLEMEADIMGEKAEGAIRNGIGFGVSAGQNRTIAKSIIQRRETEQEKRDRLQNRAERQSAKGLVDPYEIVENNIFNFNIGLGNLNVSLNVGRFSERLTNSSFNYTNEYNRNLRKKTKQVTKHSGILPKDIAHFSDFSVQNDTVVILRHVNPRAGELLQLPDVIGKPMSMKGKSSNGGRGHSTFDPTQGFIPRNQNFSKIDPAKTEKIDKYQGLVDNAIEHAKASAVQLVTESDNGKRYWYYVENKNSRDQIVSYDFYFKYSPDEADDEFYSIPKDQDMGSISNSAYSEKDYSSSESDSGSSYYDSDSSSESESIPEDIQGEPIVLDVMGDPRTGKRYTADYDTLIYAVNADREHLNMRTVPNSEYKRLNVADKMRETQVKLLKKVEIHIGRYGEKFEDLDNYLNEAILFHVFLNEIKKGSEAHDRPKVVKDLTVAQRNIYMQMSALMVDVNEETQELFREMQISIQETDLDIPNVKDVRSAIYPDEEAGIVHLNRATEQATWHASETTNKGGFKEELYEDLLGGVTIFTPDGDVELIRNDEPARAEKSLLRKINELRELGYAVFPNPRWGWRADENGRLYIPDEEDRIDMNSLNEEIKNSDPEVKEELEKHYNRLIQLLEMEYAQHDKFKTHWNNNFKDDAERFIDEEDDLSNEIETEIQSIYEILYEDIEPEEMHLSELFFAFGNVLGRALDSVLNE